jgi:hypothetical protein
MRPVGDSALFDYIRARDQGRPIRILVGKPDIKGVYFFRDDMTGLNFEFAQQSFHATLANILAYKDHPDPPAIYTGATLVSETCPDVARENTLDILDRPSRPRMWLGNAVTAATHYDNMDGINCMVAGRKRFTFFPPDQLPNLYIGPLDLAPGGQPTSMVRVSAPDLERYPRFAQALAAAETVDVEPGDAVFIPNLWWHNVESSREPFHELLVAGGARDGGASCRAGSRVAGDNAAIRQPPRTVAQDVRTLRVSNQRRPGPLSAA